MSKISTTVSAWIEPDELVTFELLDDPSRPFGVATLKFRGDMIPSNNGEWHRAELALNFYGYDNAEELAQVQRVLDVLTALRDEMSERLAQSVAEPVPA